MKTLLNILLCMLFVSTTALAAETSFESGEPSKTNCKNMNDASIAVNCAQGLVPSGNKCYPSKTDGTADTSKKAQDAITK